MPAAAAACLCPYDMACAAADNATAACFIVPAEVQAARHNFSAFGQEGQGPGQNPVCRVTPESIPTLFFFFFPLTFVGETWFGEDMVGKWLGGGGFHCSAFAIRPVFGSSGGEGCCQPSWNWFGLPTLPLYLCSTPWTPMNPIAVVLPPTRPDVIRLIQLPQKDTFPR